jgi:hypothetical protein
MVRRRRVPEAPEDRAAWYLLSERTQPEGHLPCGAQQCAACRSAWARWQRVFSLSTPLRNNPAHRVAAEAERETRELLRVAYLESHRPSALRWPRAGHLTADLTTRPEGGHA